MADVALTVATVGPPPLYQDGDVLVAIDDHTRRCVQARNLWRETHRRVGTGEYEGGGLHDAIARAFHQTKFTVLSRTTVLVERDGQPPYEVGPEPNAQGESMNVGAFLTARRRSGKKLFNLDGTVYWYGNERPLIDQGPLDVLWDQLRDGGFTEWSRWPFTDRELQILLVIDCEPFSREDANAAKEPVYGPVGASPVIRARRWGVNWEPLMEQLGETAERVRDKSLRLDLRDRARFRLQNLLEDRSRG